MEEHLSARLDLDFGTIIYIMQGTDVRHPGRHAPSRGSGGAGNLNTRDRCTSLVWHRERNEKKAPRRSGAPELVRIGPMETTAIPAVGDRSWAQVSWLLLRARDQAFRDVKAQAGAKASCALEPELPEPSNGR